MKIHDVLNAGPKRPARKRVGRGIGSGQGKTSTRGTKGHGARESFHGKLGHEGGTMPLFRRMPKRGFTNAKFRVDYSVVNVGELAKQFQAGDEVSLEGLRSHGHLKSGPSRLKVLGTGDIEIALNLKVAAISESARKKIEAAGGTVEIVAK